MIYRVKLNRLNYFFMNGVNGKYIKLIDESLSLKIKDINCNNKSVTYGVIGLRKELTEKVVEDVFEMKEYKRCKEKGLWYNTKGVLIKKESSKPNYKELMKEIYYYVFMYMFCEILIFSISYYVRIL